MITPNFFLLEITLYDLLQDSLAIIKELLVLNVRQNKFLDKLFCISKPPSR